MRAWWPALGLALLAFAGLTFTQTDADLWGHLRFGLDILRDWRLPGADPYSFTQDVPWVNHEWLSESLMAIAVVSAGYAGIGLLKATLAFAAFAIVWISLRGVRAPIRILAIIIVAAGTIHATSSLRPQLWTLLFLLIECRVLVSGHPRHLWWLPVLFAAWVNLHGGWIVGLGVLGVWAAAQFAVEPRLRRTWVLLLAASLSATLLNPYGWGLWRFIFTTVRMERAIDEWQPLWTLPWAHWLPWIACVASLIWASRRTFADKWSVLAVLVLLAYSAARVQRIESLFVSCAAVLLAPAVRQAWPSIAAWIPFPRPRFEGVVAFVMFAALAAAAFATGARSLDCVRIQAPWAPDLAARRWLDAAGSGRLVTSFNWGQYAIWHAGPRLRVSIDGRRETVYSNDHLMRHDAVVQGHDPGLRVLGAWQPEYVWLPQSSDKTRRWLGANGYRIEFNSDRSFIAVRADLPPLQPSAASEPVRPCFPG